LLAHLDPKRLELLPFLVTHQKAKRPLNPTKPSAITTRAIDHSLLVNPSGFRSWNKYAGTLKKDRRGGGEKKKQKRRSPTRFVLSVCRKLSYSDCSNHHSTGQNWSCEEYGRETIYGFGN
jgi:hypothetical protein